MSVKNEKVSKSVTKKVVNDKPSEAAEVPANDAVVDQSGGDEDSTDANPDNKAIDKPKEPKSKEDLSDVVSYKSLSANKLSSRSKGLLSYQLGFISEIDQLFIRIQANETGGYFSKEWVPVDEIEACLLAYASDTPSSNVDVKSNLLDPSFSAVTLKPCFKSKSQNNAGFLAAVLKAEGFISQVVDKANLLIFDKGLFDAWIVSNKFLAKQEVK